MLRSECSAPEQPVKAIVRYARDSSDLHRDGPKKNCFIFVACSRLDMLGGKQSAQKLRVNGGSPLT